MTAGTACPARHPDTPTEVEGNARLTALCGMALLALFTAQVITVVLGVTHVLTAHVVIGFLLAPVVAVKVGSVGWRMMRYYLGDRRYTARGAPPLYLRILGPILVALTVTLLGSGLLLYVGPHPLYAVALKTHKVTFYPWLLALLAHVAPHYLHAARLAAADLFARARSRVPGVIPRCAAVAATLAAGAVLAVVLSRYVPGYHQLHPRH